MSILGKIFGAPAVVAKGAAGAAVAVAKGASEIVERWVPSAASREEAHLAIQKLTQDAAAAARAYSPTSGGTSPFMNVVNGLVDALSRLIRPTVTILLMGAVFGWWPVNVKTVDPIILGWGESVMIFWFGARALFKDFPALLEAIKKARS
jgi:hypothetical protein